MNPYSIISTGYLGAVSSSIYSLGEVEVEEVVGVEEVVEEVEEVVEEVVEEEEDWLDLFFSIDIFISLLSLTSLILITFDKTLLLFL